MATMGLSLSCFLRGSLDLITFYDEDFKRYLKENEVVYNFMMFFLCDAIPLCFQLSTLIFGYIRRRNDQRYRLIINHSRESNMSGHLNSDLSESIQNSFFQQSYFDPPLNKPKSASKSNSSMRLGSEMQNEGQTHILTLHSKESKESKEQKSDKFTLKNEVPQVLSTKGLASEVSNFTDFKMSLLSR